jgi:tripartite-type tricarboxylate transporter receptor subunit TctC
VKERIVVLGSVPKPSTPEQFDAYIRSEVRKLGKVVKTANIRIE